MDDCCMLLLESGLASDTQTLFIMRQYTRIIFEGSVYTETDEMFDDYGIKGNSSFDKKVAALSSEEHRFILLSADYTDKSLVLHFTDGLDISFDIDEWSDDNPPWTIIDKHNYSSDSGIDYCQYVKSFNSKDEVFFPYPSNEHSRLPDYDELVKYGEMLRECPINENGAVDFDDFISLIVKTKHGPSRDYPKRNLYIVFYSIEGYRAFLFFDAYPDANGEPQNFRIIKSFRHFKDFTFLLDKQLYWDDLSEYRDSSCWQLQNRLGLLDAFMVEEGVVLVSYGDDKAVTRIDFEPDDYLKTDEIEIAGMPYIYHGDKLIRRDRQ